jgi:hypothetical protein
MMLTLLALPLVFFFKKPPPGAGPALPAAD